MKSTVHFRLDTDLVDWLDELAQELRTSRSQVLVRMILKSKQEDDNGTEREAADQAEEVA